jgi:hypothetical protein
VDTSSRSEQISRKLEQTVRPAFTDWRITMKNSLTAGFAALLVLLAVGSAGAHNKSYSGTVIASQIASWGSVGIWEKKLNCHGEADCSRALVRAGGKYVLATGNGTYALSDQTMAARYAAQKVTVMGAFDSSKKTIEVAGMQVYNSPAVNAGLQ